MTAVIGAPEPAFDALDRPFEGGDRLEYRMTLAGAVKVPRASATTGVLCPTHFARASRSRGGATRSRYPEIAPLDPPRRHPRTPARYAYRRPTAGRALCPAVGGANRQIERGDHTRRRARRSMYSATSSALVRRFNQAIAFDFCTANAVTVPPSFLTTTIPM